MKVCILAAGTGSRMGAFGRTVHKALLPLDNQAVIGRIIGQFSARDEFVIAVGHKKDQIKDYLAAAYPRRHFTFVNVNDFDGPGAGPGRSLFACRARLREPFIFTACDTLVTSALPALRRNWLGVKKVPDIGNWCSAKVDGLGRVRKLAYKVKAQTDLAFAGIAFVKDYRAFWEGLGRNRALLGGELQVNSGLEALMGRGLKAEPVKWEDAGSEENYRALLKRYSPNYSFDGKTTDVTYRHDSRIIKFFADPATSRLRYERGLRNKGAFASVRQLNGGFYSYDFVQGKPLADSLDGRSCRSFLEWAQRRLWREAPVSGPEFEPVARQFYYQKTLGRLKAFRAKNLPGGKEAHCVINGLKCLPAEELLGKLSPAFYDSALPSAYHGDLHDSNIIVTGKSSYTLIDWRESFGSSVDTGDRYYDLAKFLHTLNFSVEAMKHGRYQCRLKGKKAAIGHGISPRRRKAMEAFWSFVKEAGYDAERIRLIEALIYLNMSPLYDKELGLYLYYLGRYSLQRHLAGWS